MRYTEQQQLEAKRNRWRSACSGKEPFDSRATAEAVARRRRTKQGKRDNVAYKCGGCGKYHIGQSAR